MAEPWRLPLLGNDRFEYVRCTDEAVEYLAGNLRPSDQEEVHATVGHRRYRDALRLSILASDDAIIAVTAFGEPAAILGVGTLSVLYNIGMPWFMATPSASKHRRAFIDMAGAYTAIMLQKYDQLENHVDARNRRSVAWLQRLGFTIEPPQPYGMLRLPFHRFTLAR